MAFPTVPRSTSVSQLSSTAWEISVPNRLHASELRSHRPKKENETMNATDRPPRPRGTGSIFRLKKNGKFGETWWIKYYRNGRPFRESTHTTKLTLARKLLDERLRAVKENFLIEPYNRKLLVKDLYDGLLADYSNNELASLPSAERRWRKRLSLKFDMLAVNVRREDVDNYIAWCREQGLSNGTINRDLAALKRSFNLAFDSQKIARVPKFPKNLKELNRRKGFVEEKQYRDLAAHCTGWLRALLGVAYAFGFRKSELLNLRVRQIDLLIESSISNSVRRRTTRHVRRP